MAIRRGELGPLLALIVMTAAWGSTFFMIKDVVTRMPVPDLLSVRFAIAAVALAIVAGPRLRMSVITLRRGLLLGLLYGIGQLLQTVGLAHTAASVSGFLTGLYVVMTPLLSAVILRTSIPKPVWAAAVLATVGLGVLSLQGFSIGYGELLTVASAVVYAVHIVALGRMSAPGAALQLSVVQMAVIAILCGVVAAPDGIQLPSSGLDWAIVIYLGVIAGALTMLLQTWAQARVEASRAAVIMALEPVWAAAFAVALGGEALTWRMLLGGGAILTAMYLVELAPQRTVSAGPDPGDGVDRDPGHHGG
ncbi:MAG: DMT family transporter [Microlunatus sp.]|nr:DMT family transporter [Microlunatus sp.]MDN5769811.1 DMT family transporter [Microlunatus sp.]MDN5804768.1 DMT family transporter [Microlunatus sp.]